jgi:hypothetical protein
MGVNNDNAAMKNILFLILIAYMLIGKILRVLPN